MKVSFGSRKIRIRLLPSDGPIPPPSTSSPEEVIVIEVPTHPGEPVDRDQLRRVVQETAFRSRVIGYDIEERIRSFHWGAAGLEGQEVLISILADPGVRAVLTGAAGGAAGGAASTFASDLLKWARKLRSPDTPSGGLSLEAATKQARRYVTSEVSGTSADTLDVQESRMQAAGAIVMLRNINNDDLYEVEITDAGMVTRFRQVASEEE